MGKLHWFFIYSGSKCSLTVESNNHNFYTLLFTVPVISFNFCLWLYCYFQFECQTAIIIAVNWWPLKREQPFKCIASHRWLMHMHFYSNKYLITDANNTLMTIFGLIRAICCWKQPLFPLRFFGDLIAKLLIVWNYCPMEIVPEFEQKIEWNCTDWQLAHMVWMLIHLFQRYLNFECPLF